MAENKNKNLPQEDLDNGTILLTDEFGEEFECQFIAELTAGGNRYLIVSPNPDEEEAFVVPLRYEVDEEGNESYLAVEDDDEFEMVVDAWDQLEEEEDEDLDTLLK